MHLSAAMMPEGIFCDWAANRSNPKGRLVLTLFRLANAVTRWPRAGQMLAAPYLVFYRVAIEWGLGVELPWRLSVGPGLRLYHGQALVVNDHARIGSNCVLRHSTTIGVATTSAAFDGAAPVIGDDVDIGSNVVILGAVRIGNGAKIGAGAVVISDVPDGCVAVGNPARILGDACARSAVIGTIK